MAPSHPSNEVTPGTKRLPPKAKRVRNDYQGQLLRLQSAVEMAKKALLRAKEAADPKQLMEFALDLLDQE